MSGDENEYVGVWGQRRVSIPVDETDQDEMAGICEDNVGRPMSNWPTASTNICRATRGNIVAQWSGLSRG